MALLICLIFSARAKKTKAEVTIGWGGAGQTLNPQTIIDNIRN
jgi:hypothetical protein